jgi:hypothetical protein
MMAIDFVEGVNELVRPLWEKVRNLAERQGMEAEFDVYRTPAHYFVRYKLTPLIEDTKIAYYLSELHWGAITALLNMLAKCLGFPLPSILWTGEFFAEFTNFQLKLRVDVKAQIIYVEANIYGSNAVKACDANEFAEFLVNTLMLLKEAIEGGGGNDD